MATCHPDRPVKARGLCTRCYQTVRRRELGKPVRGESTLARRFADRVDQSGGPDACWPRTAKHPRMHALPGGVGLEIRRVAWLLAHGAEPPRYRTVEVTCGNPLCCNPKHLICPTTEERFWAFVDKSAGPNACWPWTSRRHVRKDYGQFKRQGRHGANVPAHRFAYELVHGPIPTDGVELVVMHSCDNPPCCNPAHLSLGTDADNIADMIAKGRASWQRPVSPHPIPERSAKGE